MGISLKFQTFQFRNLASPEPVIKIIYTLRMRAGEFSQMDIEFLAVRGKGGQES